MLASHSRTPRYSMTYFRMSRFGLNIRIVMSALSWTAIGWAVAMLLISLVMEKWSFVNVMHSGHIIRFYEIGYPLVALFLFSQLFAVEMDKHIFSWLLSAPLRAWTYLIHKWLFGLVILLLLYFVPLFIVDQWVISLPWKEMLLYTLVPSITLGHLAMCLTIAGKGSFAGICGPLFVWGLEVISRGMLTGYYHLFAMSYGSELLELNRMMYWVLSAVLWGVSGIFLNRRSYFLK